MKKKIFVVLLANILFFSMSTMVRAEDNLGVPVYSGAKFAEEQTKRSMDTFQAWDIPKEIVYYNTNDSFDEVFDFYSKQYNKKPEIQRGSNISSGISDESKRVKFILDKKTKISSKAKLLLVIEHIIDEDDPQSKTVIIITRKKQAIAKLSD